MYNIARSDAHQDMLVRFINKSQTNILTWLGPRRYDTCWVPITEVLCFLSASWYMSAIQVNTAMTRLISLIVLFQSKTVCTKFQSLLFASTLECNFKINIFIFRTNAVYQKPVFHHLNFRFRVRFHVLFSNNLTGLLAVFLLLQTMRLLIPKNNGNYSCNLIQMM